MEIPILAVFAYAWANFVACWAGICPPLHWPFI